MLCYYLHQGSYVAVCIWLAGCYQKRRFDQKAIYVMQLCITIAYYTTVQVVTRSEEMSSLAEVSTLPVLSSDK